jgi:hypothetical protein
LIVRVRQKRAAGWLVLFIAPLFANPSKTLVVPLLVVPLLEVFAVFQARLSAMPLARGEMINAWVGTPLAVWLIRPA